MSVLLAQRGLQVVAMDSVPGMLDLTRQHAIGAGVESRMHVALGDVHALPFEDGTFRLVLALGVIPWLHSSLQGVHEMARVLQANGHLVFSADNRARLNHLIDPRFNPALEPMRQVVKHALVGLRLRQSVGTPKATFHRRSELDEMVSSAGLEWVTASTFGFGPFTLLGREVLPGSTGVKVHKVLQRLAADNMPVLRRAGTQYLLAARKPMPATD